jgi:hypothetical protein
MTFKEPIIILFFVIYGWNTYLDIRQYLKLQDSQVPAQIKSAISQEVFHSIFIYRYLYSSDFRNLMNLELMDQTRLDLDSFLGFITLFLLICSFQKIFTHSCGLYLKRLLDWLDLHLKMKSLFRLNSSSFTVFCLFCSLFPCHFTQTL